MTRHFRFFHSPWWVKVHLKNMGMRNRFKTIRLVVKRKCWKRHAYFKWYSVIRWCVFRFTQNVYVRCCGLWRKCKAIEQLVYRTANISRENRMRIYFQFCFCLDFRSGTILFYFIFSLNFFYRILVPYFLFLQQTEILYAYITNSLRDEYVLSIGSIMPG